MMEIFNILGFFLGGIILVWASERISKPYGPEVARIKRLRNLAFDRLGEDGMEREYGPYWNEDGVIKAELDLQKAKDRAQKRNDDYMQTLRPRAKCSRTI